MCTAITLNDIEGNFYFGRTMDFSYELNPSIYICPRNYKIKGLCPNAIENKYSFIGIGQNISNVIFTDGVNEKGLCAAALYFPGFAYYSSICSENSIDSIEVVNFILGNCTDIKEAYWLLKNVNIVGVTDSITNSIAPLHWIIVDKQGKSLVVESCQDGLHLFLNPIGVLANSPNFEWHMTNLRNYINLSPYQYEEVNWEDMRLIPFGQGAGGFGLPGDFSPPSRFIRAAFLKSHVDVPKTSEESVITFFRIMESVSIPKGIVRTQRNVNDYTQYTCCMNLKTSEYFFKTYNNNQIFHASLKKIEKLDKIVEIGKLNFQPNFYKSMN